MTTGTVVLWQKNGDDNMNTMIALGQKDNAVNMISAAARKAGGEAIDELSANGVLNSVNFQRGVLAQGDKIAVAFKAAVKTILAELAESVVGRLKRLFVDSTIELGATDGTETLANATNVFKAGIYNAVKRGSCKTTPKVLLAVYEMIKDGTYAQIFGGFGENLKRLCWTESQIVAFCRDHRDLLRKDGFFLFEGEKGGFFVADVCVDGGGLLNVLVYPLTHDGVWDAECVRRIVVPQL
jgi:hypothetical protein